MSSLLLDKSTKNGDKDEYYSDDNDDNISNEFFVVHKRTSELWKKHVSSYDAKVALLRKQYEDIHKRSQALQKKQDELIFVGGANANAMLKKSNSMDTASSGGGSLHTRISDHDILEINAGGEVISVMRGTLTQLKGTRLEALFNGRWEHRLLHDSKGRIFLDINPVCFQLIVDYLNELKISTADSPPDPIHVDQDNQIFLHCLLQLFGIQDHIYNSINRKAIDAKTSKDKASNANNTKDMDPRDRGDNNNSYLQKIEKINSRIFRESLYEMHYDAMIKFLNEDDIDGDHLKLLYRASRDGWSTQRFHEYCDEQGPTITLIRSIGGYVFGGFSEISWESRKPGCWKSAPRTFLFGLKCYSGLGPTKMEQKESALETSHTRHRAVYHAYNYGPTFGGGHDIFVSNNANSNEASYAPIGHTYKCPSRQDGQSFLTGSRNFRADEIEVFAVIDPKQFSIPTSDSTKLSPTKLQQPSENNSPNQLSKPAPSEAALPAWRSITFAEFPEDLKAALENEQQELIQMQNQLEEMEKLFEREKNWVKYFLTKNQPMATTTTDDSGAHGNANVLGGSAENNIVLLNVSGKMIHVKRSTLIQFLNSVLARQFSDDKWNAMHGGAEGDAAANQIGGTMDNNMPPPNPDALLSNNISDLLGTIENKKSDLLDLKTEDLAILSKALGQLKKKEASGHGSTSSLRGGSSNSRRGSTASINSASITLGMDNTTVSSSTSANTNKVIFIEHSSYCFSKIIDQLRLCAMFQCCTTLEADNIPGVKKAKKLSKDDSTSTNGQQKAPPLPYVRDHDRNRYKKIVEYYFPGNTATFFKQDF